MNLNKKPVHRYSEAFKQQVVREVEEGSGIQAVRRKYGLSVSIIPYWIKKLGKLDLLPKLIRVEKPDEKDKVKALERQIRELKEALADTQVRYLIAESQLEIVCKQQGLSAEEIKKKLSAKPSPKQ